MVCIKILWEGRAGTGTGTVPIMNIGLCISLEAKTFGTPYNFINVFFNLKLRSAPMITCILICHM